jgi:Acyl-CoA reductase (LuxC)
LTTQANLLSSLNLVGKQLISPEYQSYLSDIAWRASNANNWFTEDNIKKAFESIAKYFLNKEALNSWLSQYDIKELTSPKKVGLVMAGNIPAVGFHDLLCVLVAGHKALIKPSSQDTVLIKELIRLLAEVNPAFTNQIEFVERMNEVDAIIATGSDNSARYFEHYFANKPHIIRKNRTSVAVLTGHEDYADFQALGIDIFTYFGLGCRNVSKIYVPEGYQVNALYEGLESYGDVILHHKYKNNSDYHKSIYLVNREPFFDNGFLMLKEDAALVSPISVLFYEYYTDIDLLQQTLATQANKIQCIVSKDASFKGSIALGKTQEPSLSDYADGVDTLDFLLKI